MLLGTGRSAATETSPDNEVVGRVLAGESEAFNILVLRWLPAAHACAYSHLANHTEAEDATQEAFIKAYQLLDQLRDTSKFGAWLITIVRNAAGRLRMRRSRETTLEAEHEARAVAPAPDMGRLDMQRQVREHVMQLEENDREVLLLHYFTGKSTPEIGEALGLSAEAVRKRLQRAREALGERLLTNAAEALQPERSHDERARAVLAALGACRVSWKPRTSNGASASTRGAGILRSKAVVGFGVSVVALLAVIVATMTHRSADAPDQPATKARPAVAKDLPSSSSEYDSSARPAGPTSDPGVTPPSKTEPPSTGAAKATRTVHGVIKEMGDKPVAGARIDPAGAKEQPAKTAAPKAKLVSDTSGRYAFEWSENISELNIFAMRFGRERILCTAMPLDADVEIQSLLTPGVSSGRRTGATGPTIVSVTDGVGAPLSGVAVRAETSTGDIVATTDTAGLFRPDTSLSEKELFLSRDDYAPESFRYYADSPINIVLRRPGALRVRVTKAGAPVPHATVRVSGETSPKAVTDADGVALYEALPAPLAYTVGLADYPDAYEITGRTTVVEGKTVDCEVHVIDRYPCAVRGSVFDADGRPVKGIELRVQQADSPANYRKITTDDRGAFEAGLVSGTSRIVPIPESLKRSFVDQGLTETSFEVKVDGTVSVVQHDFHLKRINPHVTVRLLDGEGKPVTRAEIVIVPGLQASNSKFMVTAPDGTFTTTREYANFIRAVDPDRKCIGTASVPAGADVVDVLLIMPIGKIRGRVVDQSGKAVPSITVNAYLQQTPGEEHPRGESSSGRTVSDTQGYVVIDSLPIGRSYVVQAWPEEFAVLGYLPSNIVVASATPEEFTVRLGSANAKISGRVIDDSRKPVPNASVFFNSADFNKLVYSRQVFTDESGRFSANVVAGEYTVGAARLTSTSLSSELVTVSAPASDVVLVVPFGEKTLATQNPELAQANNMMKQLGLVFKMFAGENKDKYPQLSKTFGVFSPDLSQIYPEYLNDATLADRLGGKLDVKTGYLGFLINDEESGLRVLDAYEQLGPEGLGDPETLRQYKESLGTESAPALMPLQEGVERFLITDINNPAGAAQVQSSIPITWEMPGPLRPDGGYVTYMDGHVEWVSYPGKFPMTPEFIARLNAIAASRKK